MAKELLLTVCLQTRDAERRDDETAEFTFAVHTERAKPRKVMLGSLEFPIVQYSIERSWARIYFCEGVRVLHASRRFELHERALGNEGVVARAAARVELPLHLNPIAEVHREGSQHARVRFLHAHGLWHEGACALGLLAQHDVRVYLIRARDGARELHAERVECVDAHTVRVPHAWAGEGLAHGFLHATAPPSPSALCALVDALLALCTLDGRYRLQFEPQHGRARLSLVAFGSARELTTSTAGDALCTRLGYTEGRTLRAWRGTAAAVTGVVLRPDDAQRAGSALPVALEAERFGGFDYVELPEGWYMPAHRPMATGQPLKLPSELEGRLNRFTFAPSKDAPSLCLVFRDALGRVRAAHAPAGVYAPTSLARALERALARAVGETPFRCSFEFDRCTERFRVRCWRADDRTPAAFDLLFSHPRCLDAERLGFARVDHCGHAEYESAVVHAPRLEWPRVDCCAQPTAAVAHPANLYTIGEVGSSKRLRIGATGKPSLVARVVHFDETRSVLVLETHLLGVPISHGAQVGDVVTLTELDRVHKLGEAERECEPFALDALHPVRAVCVAPAAEERAEELHVYVPQHNWDCSGGRIIGVEQPVAPFNLCLLEELEHSIGGPRLGFDRRVVEWGRDGSVSTAGRRVPPFVAPHVHALDHPDYVLMYLNGDKNSTALQHRHGDAITYPLAKIVLYPLFREERMLPRELTLSSGESPARLSVRFANPDGTAYHFHGAQFSFSLNFLM